MPHDSMAELIPNLQLASITSTLGVAPAGFGAGSGHSIPAPFNLVGLIFYQTRDPVGFGAPTGIRLIPIFYVWRCDVGVACKRVLSPRLHI
jgi:hypothetical protein